MAKVKIGNCPERRSSITNYYKDENRRYLYANIRMKLAIIHWKCGRSYVRHMFKILNEDPWERLRIIRKSKNTNYKCF